MARRNARSRIYNTRVYLVYVPQGISGFPKPPILAVVSGAQYRRDRAKLIPYSGGEGDLNTRAWRLDDGHVPDCQPRATYNEACTFAQANPWAAAYLLPLTVEGGSE